ncbi:hypothetical protein ABZT17_38100 [Streptomyces sp. NPDC005648]|uniref:hypothetical protein n=1 Tax=Streptomyces sp. NPDC005648 TaxID=3157044 RepID=UPI0033B337F3
MSDQHAADALTAAAVIASILIARIALLRHDAREDHADRTPQGSSGADEQRTAADAASPAVREAEQYVHRRWQQLRASADPPE